MRWTTGGAIIARSSSASQLDVGCGIGDTVGCAWGACLIQLERLPFIVCNEVLVQVSRTQSPESPMFCTGMLHTTASETRCGAMPDTQSRASGFAAAVRLSFSNTVDVAMERTATASAPEQHLR